MMETSTRQNANANGSALSQGDKNHKEVSALEPGRAWHDVFGSMIPRNNFDALKKRLKPDGREFNSSVQSRTKWVNGGTKEVGLPPLLKRWRERETHDGVKVTEISFHMKHGRWGTTYVSPEMGSEILKGECVAETIDVMGSNMKVHKVVDEVFFKRRENDEPVPLALYIYMTAFPNADLSANSKILHADGDLMNNCSFNLRNGVPELLMFRFFDMWDARNRNEDASKTRILKSDSLRIKRLRERGISVDDDDDRLSGTQTVNIDPNAVCEWRFVRFDHYGNALNDHMIVKFNYRHFSDMSMLTCERCKPSQTIQGVIGGYSVPLAFIVLGRPPRPGMRIEYLNGDVHDICDSNVRWTNEPISSSFTTSSTSTSSSSSQTTSASE